MKQYDIYLFDFDGTLCDTTKGIYNSVLYSLPFYGLEEKDPSRLAYFVGPPLFDSYKTLYGVDDETANGLVVRYRERYRVKAAEESELYPGVRDLLTELRRRGKTVGVVSTKPEPFLRAIAERLEILPLFDDIVTASFANVSSDKTTLITTALERFGVTDKSRALMIGDRRYDIEGAAGAGIDSAGAVYGFGTEEELTAAGATWLLQRPDDLLA